jgi:hypothetical protein
MLLSHMPCNVITPIGPITTEKTSERLGRSMYLNMAIQISFLLEAFLTVLEYANVLRLERMGRNVCLNMPLIISLLIKGSPEVVDLVK